jgi:putative endonuclease
MNAHVYMLRCADGHYYVGTTRGSLERRVAEHNDGTFGGYTSSRRPVELVYQEVFANITDAIAMERRLKGWSRAKKEALLQGDFRALKRLARPHSSFDTQASLAAQDEGGE